MASVIYRRVVLDNLLASDLFEELSKITCMDHNLRRMI